MADKKKRKLSPEERLLYAVFCEKADPENLYKHDIERISAALTLAHALALKMQIGIAEVIGTEEAKQYETVAGKILEGQKALASLEIWLADYTRKQES